MHTKSLRARKMLCLIQGYSTQVHIKKVKGHHCITQHLDIVKSFNQCRIPRFGYQNEREYGLSPTIA